MRIFVNSALRVIIVCHKKILSLHGISNRHVQTLRKKLLISGTIGHDNYGKHFNRPQKLSDK